MSSEVAICNMALANLGDSATVMSISPPEQRNRQSQLCAQFYPIARDAMLASHTWSFNSRRATVARLTDPPLMGWRYQYALPADALHVLGVLPAGATSDFHYPCPTAAVFSSRTSALPVAPEYALQPFVVELGPEGQKVILTNLEEPVIRYRARVEDVTRYTPESVIALSWLLASYLAGPLIKGEEGAKMALSCQQAYLTWVAAAAGRDAQQAQADVSTSPSAIRARA